MQLIVDSETSLAIKRDMSAIEDIHTDKVSNGDIEQLDEKNCNGNKENINGHVNVITSDETIKQVINAEADTLPNFSNDESQNTEDDFSARGAITEETRELNVPETNGTQREESQRHGTDEDIQSTPSSCRKQFEGVDAEQLKMRLMIETDEEAIENDEDIISLKHANNDEILDIADKVISENDETKLQEELHVPVNNVEVKEEPAETHTICETLPNVELEEPANTIKDEDKNLESPENEDKNVKSPENEDKNLESPENEDKNVKSPENEDKNVESLENEDNSVDPSDNKDNSVKLCDDKDESVELCDVKDKSEEPSDAKDKSLDPCDDKDKPVEPCDSEEKHLDDSNNKMEVAVSDFTEEILSSDAADSAPIEVKDDMDVEEIEQTTKSKEHDISSQTTEKPSSPVSSIIDKPIICKLSNTLDILSDDEDEPPKDEPPKPVDVNEKQCINIEDDDDIMLIDEDTIKTDTLQPVVTSNEEDTPIITEDKTESETGEKAVAETFVLFTKTVEKDLTHPEEIKEVNVSEKEGDQKSGYCLSEVPLLPDNILKSAKKNLSDMTREDLEEFCILKIVESIVDRSNLSEIKNKLKSVTQGIDEYRKKATVLTKQNRDLQVVLKSIQEEQKKMSPGTPITPLKITRSVGIQVFMEKPCARRKNLAQLQNSTNTPNTRQGTKSLPVSNFRSQKPPTAAQTIPVPRLVPASPATKSPNTIPLVNQITPVKNNTAMPNGIKNPSPSQKVAEKRQHNRIMSVTVDLTDDEPPAKVNNRTSPAPPVRVVPTQNLMTNPRQAFPAAVSSPRKVYIPISGPQNQNIRPSQTIMLKTVPTPGFRPRGPNPQMARQSAGSVRANRVLTGRHPAPLPDAMKQYQPPNWKALPPAPDLKLSKVENGIVISWKIEGFQEDSYEEIASYQLYAYQETSSPPSTTLWKKIGDVKALPLPMACTLTQFMAGFKYYFAVRAVDIRSRLGPFSLPGSILLLNKL